VLRNWIWPSVATRKHAIFAVDEAFWVVLAVSALNLVFAAIANWALPRRGALVRSFLREWDLEFGEDPECAQLGPLFHTSLRACFLEFP